MVTEERLPPACTFARSVLNEYETDPDAVPEEALEAAQQHTSTCSFCAHTFIHANTYDESSALNSHLSTLPAIQPAKVDDEDLEDELLFELLRQEQLQQQSKTATRKPVRDPFSAIGWALSGFFRGGQIPMSPKALAYGTLLLLLLTSSLAAFLGFYWNETRYHTSTPSLPAPAGVGLSDGNKVFDACLPTSFTKMHEARLAMQQAKPEVDPAKLLSEAMHATYGNAQGCHGAEAAIYRENLRVRQSNRPFAVMVVNFSNRSMPSTSSTSDSTFLSAAPTQELMGAYIAQQNHNTQQMKIANAALLYLIIANTTGTENGAIQAAELIEQLAQTHNYQELGLLAKGSHPLLAVLGFGSSSLTQAALPVFCRAGIPVIAPTTNNQFVLNHLAQSSQYRQCAPDFHFVRLSADTPIQNKLAADFTFKQLKARKVALFYNAAQQSSQETVQFFTDAFLKNKGTSIVARETFTSVTGFNQDNLKEGERAALLASLQNTLQVKTKPDIIFVALSTNQTLFLAQEIARLPQKEQPILLTSDEFIHPRDIQSLVQWTRENQVALPKMYLAQSFAVRSTSDGDWQKQFYADFCQSFAAPGNYCNEAKTLDQEALLFSDAIAFITQNLRSQTDQAHIPSHTQFSQYLTGTLNGVSGPVAFSKPQNGIVTNIQAKPTILLVQEDGNLQVTQ